MGRTEGSVRAERGLSSGNLGARANRLSSDLLILESEAVSGTGLGMERLGNSEAAASDLGDCESDLGESESDLGECEDASETASEPRLSCLLSGPRGNAEMGDSLGCLAGAEKSRGCSEASASDLLSPRPGIVRPGAPCSASDASSGTTRGSQSSALSCQRRVQSLQCPSAKE